MTTFATDDDVQTRCPIAQTALAAINAWRAAQSPALTAVTLETYRTLAYDEILRALRARSPAILPESITRPADLVPSECFLTAATVCEAAIVRAPTTQRTQNTTPDLYAEASAFWRARYAEEIAKASPVDLQRGTGNSFSWQRC